MQCNTTKHIIISVMLQDAIKWNELSQKIVDVNCNRLQCALKVIKVPNLNEKVL